MQTQLLIDELVTHSAFPFVSDNGSSSRQDPAMPSSYEAAVLELYQTAPEEFVGERKRLVAAFRAEGQKEAAQRLGKLARPPVSVWLVNQLYTRERERFDALFQSAEALRSGKLEAAASHREALRELRERAIALLTEAGRPVQEAVVRRVTTTLSTLAANGSFAPDLPGALTSDRDPIGFGAAMTFGESPAERSPEAAAPVSDVGGGPTSAAPDESAEERDRERALAEERDRERALAEERDRERARRAAERARLEAEVTAAAARVESQLLVVTRLRDELERAERELAAAREAEQAATAKLSAMENDLD